MRRAAVLAVLATLAIAAPAQGAVGYVTGTEVNTPVTGSCFSTFVKTAFTKQDGQDPKVGELFYVSLTATFVDSFDCAANFLSSALILPNGIAPAITPDTPMICRRYGTNASSQTVFDTRAATNCPASLTLSGGSYSLRPKASPVFPDIGGAGGSYWTLGYPLREVQNYPSLQLLVPVKATAAMTGATVSHFSCAVSGGCLTSSVGGLNVGAGTGGNGGGGGNGGAVGGTGTATATTSLAGDLMVGATGAALPISIISTQPFRIMTDISTVNTLSGDVYAGNRPCGFGSAAVWTEGGNPFTVDGAFTYLLGAGFDTGASPCYLTPNTMHFYRVCAVHPTEAKIVDDSCRDSSFRTSAVQASFELAEDTPAARPTSTLIPIAGRIIGPHPNGTWSLQGRLTAQGGTFYDVVKAGNASTQQPNYGAGTNDVTVPTQVTTGVMGGLTFSWIEWNAYDLRACASGTCSKPRTVIAGAMYDDQDASAVGQTTATLSALPSRPRPAGALTFRVGTSELPAKDLPLAATVELEADAATTPGTPVTTPLAGLAAGTTYFWSACFDRPAGFGVTGPEDCSAVRSFTTQSPPAPASDGGGVGTAPGTTSTPAGTTTPPVTARVCTVPRLKGAKLKVAAKRLKAAGCRVGKVRKRAARGKAGRVIKHSRKVGAKLAAGAKIDLTVSKKPR